MCVGIMYGKYMTWNSMEQGISKDYVVLLYSRTRALGT
jgi:hypothetical protein